MTATYPHTHSTSSPGGMSYARRELAMYRRLKGRMRQMGITTIEIGFATDGGLSSECYSTRQLCRAVEDALAWEDRGHDIVVMS